MAPPNSRNRLLSFLSSKDLDLLEPHLVPVRLGLRKRLETANRRIEAVYFPQSGFASVVANQRNGKEVEVGLIGREGVTGAAIVLGNHRSPYAVYIQAAGEGHCIRAADLRMAMRASQSLHALLLKFVQAFHIQTAQTAICNAQHKLEQRLARWLLMAHDRVEGDCLPLTHDFLALMLGVRRAGVTDAISTLESRRLIAHNRGQIIVRDRKGLERSAADSYGVPEAEYRRLIG
jgi:CRP-like cAMP-binding protein